MRPSTAFAPSLTSCCSTLVRNTQVGQTTSLTVVRDGQREVVDVTLAARPQGEESEELPQASTTQGAWLGIRDLGLTLEIAQAMDLASDQEGVLVKEVLPDTPAEQAGLRSGDQALTIDGQQLVVRRRCHRDNRR